MLSVNKVWVGGKLRSPITVNRTANGKEIGVMVLEVEDTYTKYGEEKVRTTLVEVKFFGRQIESYQKRFKPGCQILVEAELSSYVTKDNKIYLAVVCKHSHFVGPPNKAPEAAQDQGPAGGQELY